MNTITIQLNDKQYDAMMDLLDYAQENLSSDIEHLNKDDEDASTQEDMLAEHEELVRELISNKSYLWTDSHGFIELEIAAHHVDAIAVSGDNEPACRAAIEENGYLRHQLQEMDMEAAVGYLTDAGIEDAASKSNDDLRLYILWMACHDINEEWNMED